MAQSLAQKKIRVNALCLGTYNSNLSNGAFLGMFEDDGTSASWFFLYVDKIYGWLTKFRACCSGATQNRTREEAEEMRNNYSMVIPLERLGNAKDSLGLIELLVSDNSMYSTGEVFTLTGGISVRIWILVQSNNKH